MEFFVTAARHLETLLAEELRALLAASPTAAVVETRAGVQLTGSLADAYLVCLWSRIASRVLLPLARFPAADDAALYAGVQTIDWATHFTPAQTLAVQVDAVRSHLEHSHFAALRIKDAIVDQFRARGGARPSVSTTAPDIALRCQVFRDQASLALDLSGPALHRRGWRAAGAAAPLKETLAAAVLLRAGWPALAAAGAPLLDPMCGAGTLPIEAALIAADIAPGLLRPHWGFSAWRGHDRPTWEGLLAAARMRRAAGLARLGRTPGRIRGSDQDPTAVRAALANLTRAGLAGHVRIEPGALADCRPGPSQQPGLLVVNPPYGERLGAGDDLPALYAELGATLRAHFDGWQAAVLTGNPELGKRMRLRAQRLHTLYNGPIECRLLHFAISPAAHVSDQPRPLPAAERGPGAQMLANRLRKNQKALGKWLRSEGIGCYRLYDADLPEYALAVDIYQVQAEHRADAPITAPGTPLTPRPLTHVQEYAAPDSVDARAARRRLREALGVIGDHLGLGSDDLFFKVRRPQKGRDQYQRLGARGRLFEVAEDGLRLLVNLEDYLDTGLFLDHRETRRLLGRLASGQHLLNLFGYTGSATVHGAQGGARSTTTLDLSATYLHWARRNLALNGFTGPAHRLVQADCLEWLARAREERGRYGLIFLDPPSFSTSKRMRGTFDVQRDQVALLRQTLDLLADDGTLIFSNNLRRFRLEQAALEAACAGTRGRRRLVIEDISAQSIPRDFARQRAIHRCWLMRWE